VITNEKWEDVNRPELWDAHYKEVMDEFDKIVIPEPIDIHPDNLNLDDLEIIMMENDKLFSQLGDVYSKAVKLRNVAIRWYDIKKEDAMLTATQRDDLTSEKLRNAFAEKEAREFKKRWLSAKTLYDLIHIERSNLYKQMGTHKELSNMVKKQRYM